VTIRKIVHIDEQRCNGCGECIPNCPEGALRIVDGKARIVNDRYCDGLGACLGGCPQDAVRIIEREADTFDEAAVAALRSHPRDGVAGRHVAQGPACPGAAVMNAATKRDVLADAERGPQSSALRQWPVQLRLVPANAPFLRGADLLVAADCVPFALPDFHGRLLRGRKLLVGCPKLDDMTQYAQKLTAILKQNNLRSLTIAYMEVPCCYGLAALAQRAMADSGKELAVEEVVVGVGGDVKEAAGERR